MVEGKEQANIKMNSLHKQASNYCHHIQYFNFKIIISIQERNIRLQTPPPDENLNPEKANFKNAIGEMQRKVQKV